MSLERWTPLLPFLLETDEYLVAIAQLAMEVTTVWVNTATTLALALLGQALLALVSQANLASLLIFII